MDVSVSHVLFLRPVDPAEDSRVARPRVDKAAALATKWAAACWPSAHASGEGADHVLADGGPGARGETDRQILDPRADYG